MRWRGHRTRRRRALKSAIIFFYVIPWLTLNRAGLVIFIHPITGNDLVDHRDRALWMGAARPLELSVLRERSVTYDL